MSKPDAVQSLHATREALRTALLPPQANDSLASAEGFPRSKTMKWLLASNITRLLPVVVTLAPWLLPRLLSRRPTAALSLLLPFAKHALTRGLQRVKSRRIGNLS